MAKQLTSEEIDKLAREAEAGDIEDYDLEHPARHRA